MMMLTWALLLVLVIAIGSANAASRNKGGHVPLERGKELGRVVTAKDLYNAYQEIQSDYRQKAFDNPKAWKILNNRDGIEIAMMQHPSDPTCPYVRMTAIMPTPVIDCWNFLRLSHWDKTMPKMDPFYEGLSVFGEYRVAGVHMLLARKRTKRIFSFGKRDFVFVSVSDVPQLDGTWVSGTVSVRTPQVPRRKGYTRAYQDSVAFYKPMDHGKQTHLTIVCRIDMNDSTEGGEGGHMPMWIYTKTIGKFGLQSVRNMRNCLEQEVKEQGFVESPKQKGLLPWMRPKPEEEDAEFERESFADDERNGDTAKRLPWGMPRIDLPWQKPMSIEPPEEKAPKESDQPGGIFRFARPWRKERDEPVEEEPPAPPPQRLPYSLWRQRNSP